MRGARKQQTNQRGQSEVVGVILVLGLVIIGGSFVLVLGAAAISDVQDGMATQRAEKALTQFDAKAASVALESSEVQDVSFGSHMSGGYKVNETAGWMEISVENQENGTNSRLLKKVDLGTITYQTGNNILAYQGGGVWGKAARANASRMISPPEFHFRNGTLTLPVITVSGSMSMRDRVSISLNDAISKFPNKSRQNPLKKQLVTLKVKSEFYKAWGSYFEERTEGEARYDHENRTVTLFLLSPAGNQAVTEGLSAYSAGNLTIGGQPGDTCGKTAYIDSYNSSGTTADYCNQRGSLTAGGNVTYGGNIWLTGQGDANVDGTLKAGDDIDFNTQHWPVNGSIYFGNECTAGGASSECTDMLVYPDKDEVKSIDNIPDARSALDPSWKFQLSNIRSEAENSVSSEIRANNTLKSGPRTLDSGQYELKHLRRTDNVTFDVCDGDINVAVKGNVHLSDEASFKIKEECAGENQVNIYVSNNTADDIDNKWAFYLEKNSNVLVPNDNAPQFRMYGKRNFTARLGDNGGYSKYVGVIYAPTGGKSSSFARGEVNIRRAKVFGGIVTGDTFLKQGASVHYDEALKNKRALPRDAKIVKINYLHITLNKLTVS